jgi:hypothetical protein
LTMLWIKGCWICRGFSISNSCLVPALTS